MKLKTFVSALAFALCLGLTACGGDEPDAPFDSVEEPSDDDSGVYIAKGKCGDNITWKLDDGGALVLSGKGKMYDYSFDGEEGTPTPWYDRRKSIKKLF